LQPEATLSDWGHRYPCSGRPRLRLALPITSPGYFGRETAALRSVSFVVLLLVVLLLIIQRPNGVRLSRSSLTSFATLPCLNRPPIKPLDAMLLKLGRNFVRFGSAVEKGLECFRIVAGALILRTFKRPTR
jgi:hypothetical protein